MSPWSPPQVAARPRWSTASACAASSCRRRSWTSPWRATTRLMRRRWRNACSPIATRCWRRSARPRNSTRRSRSSPSSEPRRKSRWWRSSRRKPSVRSRLPRAPASRRFARPRLAPMRWLRSSPGARHVGARRASSISVHCRGSICSAGSACRWRTGPSRRRRITGIRFPTPWRSSGWKRTRPTAAACCSVSKITRIYRKRPLRWTQNACWCREWSPGWPKPSSATATTR